MATYELCWLAGSQALSTAQHAPPQQGWLLYHTAGVAGRGCRSSPDGCVGIRPPQKSDLRGCSVLALLMTEAVSAAASVLGMRALLAATQALVQQQQALVQQQQQALMQQQPPALLLLTHGSETPLAAHQDGGLSACAYGGTSGFARTLRTERPSTSHVVSVQVASLATLRAAQLLHPAAHGLSELLLAAHCHYVPSLRRGSNVVPEKEESEEDATARAVEGRRLGLGLAMRATGSCVIIGGMGGLGLNVTNGLLRDGQCRHVTLTTRSGLVARNSQGLGAKLQVLVKGGCVGVRICDSSDADDVASLVRATLAMHTDSVMHMPHVLRDRVIHAMQLSDLPYVFSAKAHGAMYLHTSEAQTPLECFRLFSSVASFGGVGIAAHSSANAYLNGLAAFASSHGKRTNAIMIPVIMGEGAGAAVALQGKMGGGKGLDSALETISLSMDQFLDVLLQSLCLGSGSGGCSPQNADFPLRRDANLSALGGVVFTPLLVERFTQQAHSLVSGTMTVAERVAAATASQIYLDQLVQSVACRSTDLPRHSKIVIVGMGLAGLAFVFELAQVEPSLVVLEKTSSIGGVWRWQGNPASRVNK